jgi:hypothetical protein
MGFDDGKTGSKGGPEGRALQEQELRLTELLPLIASLLSGSCREIPEMEKRARELVQAIPDGRIRQYAESIKNPNGKQAFLGYITALQSGK